MKKQLTAIIEREGGWVCVALPGTGYRQSGRHNRRSTTESSGGN